MLLSVSLPFLLQCVNSLQTSSRTNFTSRTTPQPSQEPVWLCASGSLPQKRRSCWTTTSSLSVTSFTRCVLATPFLPRPLCFSDGSLPCRPWTMWKRVLSNQSRSSTSCRSWPSRKRCRRSVPTQTDRSRTTVEPLSSQWRHRLQKMKTLAWVKIELSCFVSTWVYWEGARATTRSSSPTVPVTPGVKATSSPPSAFTTSSCTPAPRKEHWRQEQQLYLCARVTVSWGPYWHRSSAPESGNRVWLGRDAEVGYRWRGHGVLLWVRPRREETTMGQDIHTLCE